MKLFLVTVPKEVSESEEKQKKSDKDRIAVAEQFLSSLVQIKPRSLWKKFCYGSPSIVFEIAVPHIGEEIYFYVAVPRGYEDFIEKQIQGFYPNAAVELVEDYNIFAPKTELWGDF